MKNMFKTILVLMGFAILLNAFIYGSTNRTKTAEEIALGPDDKDKSWSQLNAERTKNWSKYNTWSTHNELDTDRAKKLNMIARKQFNDRIRASGNPDLCLPDELPDTTAKIRAETEYIRNVLPAKLKERGISL